MVLHTKIKGKIGELEVISRLLEKGYHVYESTTEDSPIDVIIEKNGKLERMQIKFVTPTDGKLCVPLKSSTTKYRKAYKNTTVDCIGVYDSENDKCYLIPIIKGVSRMNLRLYPTKSNQQKNINYAKDFEL